jgi:hypothetical protein
MASRNAQAICPVTTWESRKIVNPPAETPHPCRLFFSLRVHWGFYGQHMQEDLGTRIKFHVVSV